MLPPLITGILLQWYLDFAFSELLVAAISFITAFIAIQFLPLALRFKLQPLQGSVINLILIMSGSLLTYQNDIRHSPDWVGHYYKENDRITVTINEPLVEKSRSFKAEGLIQNLVEKGKAKRCTGKLVLYFAKDSTIPTLHYGDVIIISNPLQPIRNSGNPGSFNYKRYSAFQQVFHQVYLQGRGFLRTGLKQIDPLREFIFAARQKILGVLKKRLGGHDEELSIAEALLIGYTQDLDRDLVQAYSNTGVVHIIAISGLHLGLIYVMLVWIFKRIPFVRRSKIIRVLFILSSLWIFSLITGGSASVLRSAVMFTCIVIGESFQKRSSIYNSLAASAFLLLSYNPYFLWDVGFQLSYLAVLGIVIFQRPLYHLFYIRNKLCRQLWQLASVSLAAQFFTFPVCLYYFHQFPTTFLFTNIIMVPLSSLILFIEIFLLGFGWWPVIAQSLGNVIYGLVWLMNRIIIWFNHLPFALWQNIPATICSTILLYGIIIFIASWLMYKNKTAFKLSLFCLSGFMLLEVTDKWKSFLAQKIIIYNVPQHLALDFVAGNSFAFVGDTAVLEHKLYNFHLKPAHIALRLDHQPGQLPGLIVKNKFFRFNGINILLIDSSTFFQPLTDKIIVQYIILSKNSMVSIPQLMETFTCKHFIFDASNSLWKIGKWKKDLEQLHLPFYSVPEQGAFIIEI